MYVPKINTSKGRQPITVLPDKMLLEAYLNSDASPEEKELARYLVALDDAELSGRFLRMCFNGGRLVAVYPGDGEKAPASAHEVCTIPDGVLYLATAPSKS